MTSSICYIHMGAHKTASSFLQNFILCNVRFFASQGVHIPLTATHHYTVPHHNLAWQLRQDRRFNPQNGTFEDLQEELSHHQGKSILISSEDFEDPAILESEDRLNRLIHFFKKLGYKLVLFFYIRPQDSCINSEYTQFVKQLGYSKRFDRFYKKSLNQVKYNYCVYYRLLIEKAKTNPELEVIFRPFNQSVKKFGVHLDFLQSLGICTDMGQMNSMTLPQPSNENPGAKTIEAILWTNTLLSKTKISRILSNLGLPKQNKDMIHVTTQYAMQRGWHLDKFQGLDAQKAQQIRSNFAESNELFSQSVWGRSWSEVFQAEAEFHFTQNTFDFRRVSLKEKLRFLEFVLFLVVRRSL